MAEEIAAELERRHAIPDRHRGFVGGLATAPTAAAQVISPELLAGGRAIVRLASPRAGEVEVRGDWVKPGDTIAMAKDAAGVWSATVGPLEPTAYIYSFQVDGESLPDPINPAAKLRSAGVESLLQIPADPPTQSGDAI